MSTPLPDGANHVALPEGMDPAFVRSVRFWSRAYPRRWRAARGAELLGLLADLAKPTARRLDAGSVLDIVRAGWATRMRDRPPLGPWLQYRLLGRRALSAYRPWVADDIAGALFPARNVALPIVVFAVFDVVVRWSGGTTVMGAWFWAVLAGAVVVDELLLGGRTRVAARETHLVPRPGERVTPGSWVLTSLPRRRVAATAGLPWAASAAVILLAVSVAATVLAPTAVSLAWLDPDEGFGFSADGGGSVPRVGVLAAMGAALVAGSMLGVLAWRRLARVDAAVGQPERALVRLGARQAAGVVLGTVAVGAIPVAEGLGTLSLLVGPGVGMVTAVLLPPAVVAWLVIRRRPELQGLAYVDVRRVVLLGRPPRVDRAGSRLSPAGPSQVGVVQPWPWSNEGPTTALG